MKVISLTQPWASLVAIGAKQIETRSWRTHYRGLLGIHASQGFPAWARDFADTALIREAFQNAPSPDYSPDTLPLCKIVAVCHLADCVSTNEHARQPKMGTFESFVGDYNADRYMWFLENIRRLREPIPAKGALQLWNVDHCRLLRSDAEALGICTACGEELPVNAYVFGGYCDETCREMAEQ